MSTLTKALVLLLSISAIFLCGIVITYVGSANNYKAMYDSQQQRLRAAEQTSRKSQDDLNAAKAEYDRKEAELNTKLAASDTQQQQIQAALDDANRKLNAMQAESEKWRGVTTDTIATVDAQRQQVDNALAQVQTLEATKIKQDKELKETTATLVEKMAIISTLQNQNKQLMSERTELRGKLDALMRQYGKEAPVTNPVAERQPVVRQAPKPVTSIGINGKVTAVDMKNSLAEISIGSANGVREDMKFHVTRGSEFVCDILILDVDVDKAVGILDLVRHQPQAGDAVSTNL